MSLHLISDASCDRSIPYLHVNPSAAKIGRRQPKMTRATAAEKMRRAAEPAKFTWRRRCIFSGKPKMFQLVKKIKAVNVTYN